MPPTDRQALDIADPRFMAWLREQDPDIRFDLEVFWRSEVVRHPFICAHPETAGGLRARMLTLYAADNYGYELPRGA